MVRHASPLLVIYRYFIREVACDIIAAPTRHLILIRHGQYDLKYEGEDGDPPLTELGELQVSPHSSPPAAGAAEVFSDRSRVVISPPAVLQLLVLQRSPPTDCLCLQGEAHGRAHRFVIFRFVPVCFSRVCFLFSLVFWTAKWAHSTFQSNPKDTPKPIKISEIHCSDVKRARQTAEIIAAALARSSAYGAEDGVLNTPDPMLAEGAPCAGPNWRPYPSQLFEDGARIEAAYRKYFKRSVDGWRANFKFEAALKKAKKKGEEPPSPPSYEDEEDTYELVSTEFLRRRSQENRSNALGRIWESQSETVVRSEYTTNVSGAHKLVIC